MRLGLFIALLSFLALQGWAQKITVSGVAVDKETREPLPFASVGIKGKSIGTITNLQGEFDFHIPNDYRNEILVISMLGYVNYEAPVWTLPANPTFELSKSTTVLNEVVVTDSLSGGDILRIALSRIDTNYPMKPFMMEGFYRDVKKVASTNISLLEAAVKIYDEDYAEPRNKYKLRERVRLIEVRKSLGYESRFTAYFDQDNLLEDLLLHNNIRYRQIEAREEMYNAMTRQADSYYNGHEIYVIAHTKDYLLKIFVDKQDYAIVHLDFETGSSNELVGKKKKLVSRFAGLRKTIDFRPVDGKMYLSYMSITSKVTWHDIKTDELKFETELFQQLLINEVKPNTSERIGGTEKMRNYGLQYQDQPYNKSFWDNYNVIKDTPLDKKILEDLEKAGPLQKQFEGGNN
ncbi:MAG TPA: carboxypeptidase-like regulatory domain-containing protein [Cyclobacteriaceae bacterium]|nr:carboxypeptidase-like regulatory domain-containing protein [Cyclobacteriaceae bacterium]HRJ81994.1 carboxypeptidase-like regulatory domain-containing protein [Cyclobacteriaceae bacterium]